MNGIVSGYYEPKLKKRRLEPPISKIFYIPDIFNLVLNNMSCRGHFSFFLSCKAFYPLISELIAKDFHERSIERTFTLPQVVKKLGKTTEKILHLSLIIRSFQEVINLPEYFPNLKSLSIQFQLNCETDEAEKESQNSVFDILSKTKISQLDISKNRIFDLNHLPPTLAFLDISDTQCLNLTSLNKIAGLKELILNGYVLHEKSKINESIEILQCDLSCFWLADFKVLFPKVKKFYGYGPSHYRYLSYFGDQLNGKWHGDGYLSAKGFSFKGSFSDGKINGDGILTTDGSSCEGVFYEQDGELICEGVLYKKDREHQKGIFNIQFYEQLSPYGDLFNTLVAFNEI